MTTDLTFDELMERAAPYADAFLGRSTQTITHSDSLAETPPHRARPPEPGLTFLGVLGVGGMSVVRLARQESVGREVAVKMRPRGRRDPGSALRLQQEARLTGSLEHPNVVPLHDVRLEEGEPQVILKRIEGHSWEAVLEDPSLIPGLDGSSEPLTWNINVLIAVCRAVEYAHDKGILHRDIKPENVMVGRFGEVTVLDWGIAVSTRDADETLPRWSAADGIVGTPVYMAPEMVHTGRPPDERLDVYLLGATLARILTGSPPHRGSTLEEVLSSINAPVSLEVGPPALRALCAQAMAVRPEDRLQTAAGFRQALVRYLDDRTHDQLVEAAQARLGQLRSALQASAAPEEIHALLAACRFGFSETLAARPEHAAARAGLDEALLHAARWALDEGRPDLAAGYIAESEHPDPVLAAAIQAQAEARTAAVAHAEQIIADHDPLQARQTRALIGMALWMGSAVLPLLFISPEELNYNTKIAVPVIAAGLLIATVLIARPALLKNLASRTFVILLVLLPPIQMLFETVAVQRGWSTDAFGPNILVMGLLVSIQGALQLDRRIGLASLTFVGSLLACAVIEGSVMVLVSLSNCVLGLTCLWVYLSARLSTPLPPS